jgi:DNA polymerase III subunit epsilon
MSQVISRCDLPLPQWCKQCIEQKSDWVILDTETTGKDSSKSEVVEIGIVDHRGQTLLSERVKPKYEISVDAQRIHHITNSDVINAPPFSEVWPRILLQLSGKRIVVYNAQFDSGILVTSAKYYGITVPSFRWHCLMEDYADFYGKPNVYRPYLSGWQKLSEACRQQNVQMSQAHSALGDCQSVYALMRSLAFAGENAPVWRRAGAGAELGEE